MARRLPRVGRFVAALTATALIATTVAVFVGATPAGANISGALPADGFGDITYDFTTDDALFAYVISDIKGGRVCVVDASDDFDSGTCANPAFGKGANTVVGIGTIYTLLEGPPLDEGQFMLRWEKQDPTTQEWVFGGTGEVFTVGPCVEDCASGIGRQQADAFKAASANIRKFNKEACAAFAGKELISSGTTAIRSRGTRGVDVDSISSNVSTASQGWAGAVVGGLALTFLDVSPGADAALRILKELSCAVGKMYDDIANDPPDPNYDQIAVAAPVPVGAMRTSAETALATAMARNHAFSLAALRSYERYQGALADGALDAQREQADATATNARGMVTELRATAAALRTWADVAATDPDIDGAVFPTSAARSQLIALYQRVVNDGFTAGETSNLAALGYSPTEIQQVRTHFSVDLSLVPVGADLASIARAVADGLEAQVGDIDAFARQMGSIASTSLAPPVASFTATADPVNPTKYTFTSTSQSPDGDPLQLTWNFGDGTTGTGTTVIHTFPPAGGAFDVTLTAYDGFTTDTDTQPVPVAPLNQAPQPIPDVLAVRIGETGTIDLLANDFDLESDELTLVDWTPAEGGVFDCETDGVCTYATGPDPGRERLSYTVSDGTSSVQGALTVNISEDGKPAVGGVILSLPKNGSITFPVPVADPDSPAYLLSLEIIDGPAHGAATFTGQNLSYFPDTDYIGADQLTYRAFDGTSWSSPGTADITVLATNTAPTLAGDSVTVESGVPFDIPLLGTDADGNTLTYYIDGVPTHGSLVITGATARYTAVKGYDGPDSFTLRATDGFVASEAATFAVDVDPSSGTPIADLGPDRIVDEGLVSLDVLGVFDPDGTIESWSFDWGDGDDDTAPHPITHRYDDGTYTLTVTVTDDDGLTATDSIELTVRNVAPTVGSLATSFPRQAGAQMSFAASVLDEGEDPLTYEWTLDTGVTSTDPNPIHTYLTGGTRLVKVVVTDDDGLTATDFVEIDIEPLVVDLGDDLELPEGSTITLEPDASPAPAGGVGWTWDFGDGTTATPNGTSISHTYADDAPRTITLEVANTGASVSDSLDVTFTNVAPVVAPAVPVALDPGDEGTFLAGAIDPGADDLTIEWDFGDGTTGTGPRLQHAYAEEGDYKVTVTVTDDEGAVTEATAGVVEVAPQPARPFTNRGRSFSVGFSTNEDATPVTLSLLISGEQDATGYVAVPGLGFRREFAIQGGRTVTIEVPTNAMRGEGVGENAVLVRSRQEVSVHGMNRQDFTTDAFMAMPDDVAGTSYRAMSYTNGGQIAVLAVEPDTEVTVGSEPPFVLQPGQVWRTSVSSPPTDVIGWSVTSDKPVQVFSGNRCTAVLAPFCDHLAEGIPPTEAWGERFLTVPLATRLNGDTFRILAAEDGTIVSVDGDVVATLDAGQFHEQLIDASSEITATAPILVAQFSNGTLWDSVVGDPFMALVPPFEQWLTSYVTTTARGIEPNFLNLVVRTDGVAGVTVDGSAVTGWSPIGGTGYSGAQVPVADGEHRIESVRPVSVLAYGFGDYDSYGYPGGMAIAAVTSVAELTAQPDTGAETVGDETCVTAHVSDGGGAPVGGIRVDIERTGANPGIESVFTGADGDAEHCYTGTDAGEDDIELSTISLSASAVRTWEAPTPTTAPTVSAGPDRTVVEGDDVVLAGSAIDLDAAGPLALSWSPSTGLDDDTLLQPTFSAVDDGVRTFTLLACDEDACDTDTVDVTVTNAPPVMTLDAPIADVVLGAPVTLDASFTDAGVLDTHTATIDWGEGDGAQATSAAGHQVSGQHTYAAAGLHSITACVRDDDGGIDCTTDSVVVTAPLGGIGGDGGGGGGGAPPPTGGPAPGGSPDVDLPGPDEPLRSNRLAGPDRDATSIEISRDLFPEPGSADVVVLATADTFVDALAGTPLAVALHGPLLLTPGDELDPRIAAEIRRVLATDGEVLLLGGTAALDAAVEEAVRALGFQVRRIAGATRFSTAVAIAHELPNAEHVLLVDGWHFPDALVAGAAAAQIDGVVLLTDGDAASDDTAALLASEPGTDAVAVGGPASRAHPDATALAGQDRYDTAVLVAVRLLGASEGFGFASGAVFADALPGGVHAGMRGWPLVLLPPSGSLPTPVSSHLAATDGTSQFVVYGGTAAIADAVIAAVRDVLAR